MIGACGLLLVLLTLTLVLGRIVVDQEADLRAHIEKYAYIKAQYENQKVQLYELDNRLTQAEAKLLATGKE